MWLQPPPPGEPREERGCFCDEAVTPSSHQAIRPSSDRLISPIRREERGSFCGASRPSRIIRTTHQTHQTHQDHSSDSSGRPLSDYQDDGPLAPTLPARSTGRERPVPRRGARGHGAPFGHPDRRRRRLRQRRLPGDLLQ
eukprot:3846421-Prymnesium_polylepis.1